MFTTFYFLRVYELNNDFIQWLYWPSIEPSHYQCNKSMLKVLGGSLRTPVPECTIFTIADGVHLIAPQYHSLSVKRCFNNSSLSTPNQSHLITLNFKKDRLCGSHAYKASFKLQFGTVMDIKTLICRQAS